LRNQSDVIEPSRADHANDLAADCPVLDLARGETDREADTTPTGSGDEHPSQRLVGQVGLNETAELVVDREPESAVRRGGELSAVVARLKPDRLLLGDRGQSVVPRGHVEGLRQLPAILSTTDWHADARSRDAAQHAGVRWR
jgi:hypothetical protein